MSSAKGTKWVSQRVQQHQQQTGPVPGAAAGGTRTSGNGGAANAGAGAKIMEDSVIAAQRIKEAQAAGARASPAAEMPVTLVFERQEATDALSNFAHNEDWTPYEVKDANKPVFTPALTNDEFNAKMLKDLESLGD